MKINYYEISRIPTVDAKKVLATIEDDELHPGRKRRRLDNLNIEERVLRRKLKNRVAAQTARDRKKAHMDNLEVNLTRIERENKFLKQSNEELRSQVHQLVKSNLQLKSKLGLTPPASPTQDYTCLTTSLKKDKYQIITPSVCDHDHIVIKKEELPLKHASLLFFSLLWNILLPILVFLITMCKTSHRLNYCLMLLETTNPSKWLDPNLSMPLKPPDVVDRRNQVKTTTQTASSNQMENHRYSKTQNRYYANRDRLNARNSILTIYYLITAMRLYVLRAQNHSRRHLLRVMLAQMVLKSETCVTNQNLAWWGTHPIMDID